MSSEDEANDILMGGGGVSFAFDEIGDTVTGVILSLEPMQQTDFRTKEPLFWDDGRKRMQVKVALQTDLTDGEGTKEPDEVEDDDGVRNVYLRYKSADAVKKAVRAAGAKKLQVGGKLRLAFTGKEKPRERGAQPTKLYEARYKPPVDEVDVDDMDGSGEADSKPASRRRSRAQDDDEDAAPTRSRSRSRARDDDDDEPPAKPTRGRRSAPADDDDDDDQDDEPPAKPARSRRKAAEDPGF